MNRKDRKRRAKRLKASKTNTQSNVRRTINFPNPFCEICGALGWNWRYDVPAFSYETTNGVVPVEADWRICHDCKSLVDAQDHEALIALGTQKMTEFVSKTGASLDAAELETMQRLLLGQFFARVNGHPTPEEPEWDLMTELHERGARTTVAWPSGLPNA